MNMPLSVLLSLASMTNTAASDIHGFSVDQRGWHEAMECAALRPHLNEKDYYQDELTLFDVARQAAEQIGQQIGKDAAETEKRIGGYSQRHATLNTASLGQGAAYCLQILVPAAKRSQGN